MADNIVILTGAGVSAESGLGTYRGPGGLWNEKRIEDLATPEGFARNPGMVIEFHNMRRKTHREATHNAAHEAIARLQREWPGEVTLITQNVDVLHELAGSPSVLHMHGVMDRLLCMDCGSRWPWPLALDVPPGAPCSECGGVRVRPDIVWFGEMPHHMDEIQEALAAADLFVAVGTSGHVYPAAGFVRMAAMAGAETLEINLEPSLVASDFDHSIHGKGSEVMPAWVDDLLRRGHNSGRARR